MSETLIKVEGVSKKFCRSLKKSLWYGMQDLGREITGRRHGGEGELRLDEFWAVNDVSFELKRGECLGLIGRNGAGKTTLLRMLNGLIKPDRGRIEMRGRVGALIALGAGFNPILTGRENIYVNASVLGLTKQEIDAKLDEIIDFAEIGEFIDMPVQSYSSGMNVRLGFAVATTLKPDILILDEILAVGDFSFHAKCYKKIGEISRNSCLLFVSHDQSALSRICNSGLLLSGGLQLFHGEVNETLRKYNALATSTSTSRYAKVLHEAIKFVDFSFLENSAKSVQATDQVFFKIDIEAKEAIRIGKFLITLYNEFNLSSGQADLTGQITELHRGMNVLDGSFIRLDLAVGRYKVNVAIFHENGRDTIAHLIACAEISVCGTPFLGSPYKIPVSLSRKSGL